MNEYKIGQIFTDTYPPEAAQWCNSNRAYITEIASQGGVRRFQIVAVPEPTISEARTAALSRIDSATSATILAGFEYEIDPGTGTPEVLHFSYLAEDQQNFGDTFNGVAMRKLMGIEELPEAIGWNGWRNHTTDYKGDMVRLTLDADAFLALYIRGALAHKSAHMAIHGERKKAIEAAVSVEEINKLLEEWEV